VKHGYPERADLEYDEPSEGFPEADCAVCGEAAAIRVRWWETVHPPISKTRFVRAGRSETHFFCFRHRAVSWRVYARFTTMRSKPRQGPASQRTVEC
jgi:hypothetical protein